MPKPGPYFERQVKRALQHAGYYVVRAAGSRGETDLMALRKHGGGNGARVLLVQCKVGGKMSSTAWNSLYHLARRYGAIPILAYRTQRGLIRLMEITSQRVTGVRYAWENLPWYEFARHERTKGKWKHVKGAACG